MTTAAKEKPGRLLTTGAVQIMFCTEGVVTARVRGDSGPIYDVRWSRMAGWDCTCAAYRSCTHIEAVAQVTTRPISQHPNHDERTTA
jgi:uncharacterized Zn finger protein